MTKKPIKNKIMTVDDLTDELAVPVEQIDSEGKLRKQYNLRQVTIDHEDVYHAFRLRKIICSKRQSLEQVKTDLEHARHLLRLAEIERSFRNE